MRERHGGDRLYRDAFEAGRAGAAGHFSGRLWEYFTGTAFQGAFDHLPPAQIPAGGRGHRGYATAFERETSRTQTTPSRIDRSRKFRHSACFICIETVKTDDQKRDIMKKVITFLLIMVGVVGVLWVAKGWTGWSGKRNDPKVA